MQNNINRYAGLILALFTATQIAAGPTQTPASNVRDDEWRRQELRRAEKLINQHDFSPIDEAFAKKDLLLLWCYYVGSTELPMHLYPKATPKSLATTPPERIERVKMLIEKTELTSNYLRQIPGHARMIGDMIEETVYLRAGGGGMRSTYLGCLYRLGQDGSDECIEQLGRFLFDPRDPGFRPLEPGQRRLSEYDTRGIPNPVQSNAVSSLFSVLKVRFEFAKALVDEEGLPAKDFEEKVRAWWLTSVEATPYRRSLAATGVMLPPGYPPMKELEGTPTKIAPPP